METGCYERILRRTIVSLMKARATCTAISKKRQWKRLTLAIDALQREIDRSKEGVS